MVFSGGGAPAAYFGADRTVLVFAGFFDANAMKDALKAAFGGWAKARGAQPKLKAAPRATGRSVLLVDSPGSVQTYFWLGNVGVNKYYSGRPALDLVNTLYGGRFTSILNTELRIKSGLTYGASSRFTRGTVPGEFAIQSFTQTDDTGKAIEYEGTLATKRSRRGLLQGHVVLGYQLARKAGIKAKLDSERLERLEHIILSHQGEPEWGAAVYAATPEAVFVSMVDNLDAKMGMVQRALRQADENDEFSERLAGLSSPLLTRKLPPVPPIPPS